VCVEVAGTAIFDTENTSEITEKSFGEDSEKMRMDKTQRGWAAASLAIFAAALVVYFFEAWRSPNGPRGSSAIGLIFGAVGFGFMIFAAGAGCSQTNSHLAIGARKILDARAFVVRAVGAPTDSVSWRISFWRNIDASVDVVVDRHGS